VFEEPDACHIWLRQKQGQLAVLENGAVIFDGDEKRLHIPMEKIRLVFNRSYGKSDLAREIQSVFE
jgi:hypothetical protein